MAKYFYLYTIDDECIHNQNHSFIFQSCSSIIVFQYLHETSGKCFSVSATRHKTSDTVFQVSPNNNTLLFLVTSTVQCSYYCTLTYVCATNASKASRFNINSTQESRGLSVDAAVYASSDTRHRQLKGECLPLCLTGQLVQSVHLILSVDQQRSQVAINCSPPICVASLVGRQSRGRTKWTRWRADSI